MTRVRHAVAQEARCSLWSALHLYDPPVGRVCGPRTPRFRPQADEGVALDERVPIVDLGIDDFADDLLLPADRPSCLLGQVAPRLVVRIELHDHE